MWVDLGGCAVKGVGLRSLAFWDCGFEFLLWHGCLTLVSVVLCQVEVFATGWSHVQGSPAECGVSEYDQFNRSFYIYNE